MTLTKFSSSPFYKDCKNEPCLLSLSPEPTGGWGDIVFHRKHSFHLHSVRLFQQDLNLRMLGLCMEGKGNASDSSRDDKWWRINSIRLHHMFVKLLTELYNKHAAINISISLAELLLSVMETSATINNIWLTIETLDLLQNWIWELNVQI